MNINVVDVSSNKCVVQEFNNYENPYNYMSLPRIGEVMCFKHGSIGVNDIDYRVVDIKYIYEWASHVVCHAQNKVTIEIYVEPIEGGHKV